MISISRDVINCIHSAQNIWLRVFLCGIPIALIILSCSEKEILCYEKRRKDT